MAVPQDIPTVQLEASAKSVTLGKRIAYVKQINGVVLTFDFPTAHYTFPDVPVVIQTDSDVTDVGSGISPITGQIFPRGKQPTG